jgi:C4-dicarboxylate-specific signal transduction histidine kinase
MKKSHLLILLLCCVYIQGRSQEPDLVDSLNKEIQEISKEKAELEARFIEMSKSTASRNLGLNFGLGGAMLGFLFMSIGFYRQYNKAKVANEKLEKAYKELRTTQEQLVKSEKMAAFGMMATRLSHEILNPLNFVNNFSEMSQEMLEEISDPENVEHHQENIKTLSQTLMKINEHGKRASSIVKELQDHTTRGTAHEFFEAP